VKDPVVPAAEPKAYRPPFWESKKFGEPYGDFNRKPPPRNVVRVAPPSPGRPHTTTRGEPADLTNRPAVARSLNAMDASSAFAAARARAKAAKPVAVDDARATGVMAAYTRNVSCPSLPALEHRMRVVLKQGKQLHERDTDDLLRAFAEFGVSVSADVNGRSSTNVDAIDRAGFVRAWRALGVAVTDAEAVAVFNKYGQTRAGLMPTRVFAEALLVPPARLSNMATAIRKGAFTRAEAVGKNKLVGHRAFHGKIVYPPCRKGVFTPSGFDGSDLVRSAGEVDAKLELEFVHGYARDCHANNLFYIKAKPPSEDGASEAGQRDDWSEDTEIVYCAAGLGVVYDKRTNKQRFFRGHTDDVKCLTVSRAKDLCASGQLGREPTAIVWDPYTCISLKVLTHPRGTRGVAAVGFDRDAATLATVGMDNNHTIFIWDWRLGACLHQLRGHADVPPKVYGVVFDWVGEDPAAFLTYGVNHVKFWKKVVSTADAKKKKNDSSYVEESGKFGPVCKKHAVVSAAYLPSGRVLTGTPEGSIAVWSASGPRRITRVVRAHAAGPSVARVDGPPTHHGVRCLRLRADGETLLSAGADGHVIAWDVKDGDLKESSVIAATPVRSADGRAGAPPVFVGLDCSPNARDAFAAGTDASDVWEVVAPSSSSETSNEPVAAGAKRVGIARASSSRVLVNGHSSDLYSVAWSPTEAATYATASEGETVNVWCADSRVLKRAVSLGNKARSLAFSPSGAHLAVGCVNGGVHVLDAATLVRVRWIKTFSQPVTDLKYSPDGELLAACSSERRIDVYDVRRGYKLVSKCSGHGASVKHVDWSEDSRVLRTSCAAYEILHFDPRTGKQIVSDNQRDTAWHTRTSVLGFDAMGIWPYGADGTDVNAVDRSRSRRHLVTADDFGGVNVFNYPAVVDEAPRKKNAGHSSHVMNARFSPDDAWVVSVGGKDRAVFQWRFREVTGEDPEKKRSADPPWARVGDVDDGAVAAAREKARLEARKGSVGENAPWARPPALDLSLEDLPDLPAPGADEP
jgi:WD40 repeat protein